MPAEDKDTVTAMDIATEEEKPSSAKPNEPKLKLSGNQCLTFFTILRLIDFY